MNIILLFFAITNFKFIDVEKEMNKKQIDTSYFKNIKKEIIDFIYFDTIYYEKLSKLFPNLFKEITLNKKNFIFQNDSTDENYKKRYKKEIKSIIKYSSIIDMINDYENFKIKDERYRFYGYFDFRDDYDSLKKIDEIILFQKNKYLIKLYSSEKSCYGCYVKVIFEYDSISNKIYSYIVDLYYYMD